MFVAPLASSFAFSCGDLEHLWRSATGLSLTLRLTPDCEQIAEEIRYLIKAYDKVIPTILEIPSKDAQYDESKDEVLQRVQKLLGRD